MTGRLFFAVNESDRRGNRAPSPRWERFPLNLKPASAKECATKQKARAPVWFIQTGKGSSGRTGEDERRSGNENWTGLFPAPSRQI